MGYVDRILPHYTFEDWVRWEGKWELIEGTAIALVPLPPPVHQLASAKINSILHLALKEIKSKKYYTYPSVAYKITDDTIVQPDTLIVCGNIQKDYLDFPPLFVLEIVSTSTALRDRYTKYALYQQQGIKYYLIVDTDKQTMEIYSLIDAEYQLQAFSNNFTFILDEGCEITPGFSEVWE